jgi:phage gp36-like protein
VAELTQEVLRRYSRQFLTELTNQDETGGQQVDMAVLQAAATDAQAQFLTEGGVVYDGDNAQHVQVCALGAIFYLHQFTGRYTEALRAAREAWINALARFSRRAGDRAGMLPVTNSKLEPTTQRQGSTPDFDRKRWQDVVPDMPGISNADEQGAS